MLQNIQWVFGGMGGVISGETDETSAGKCGSWVMCLSRFIHYFLHGLDFSIVINKQTNKHLPHRYLNIQFDNIYEGLNIKHDWQNVGNC